MTTTTIKVTLEKPLDWRLWDEAFKGKAKEKRLWEYIDPKDLTPPPLLVCPKRPTPDMARANPVLSQSIRSTRTSTPVSTTVTPTEAITAANLTPDERLAYKDLKEDFAGQEKDFEKQIKAIGQLKDWMRDTISPHYQACCCKSDDSLRTWYTNLIASVRVDPEEIRRDIRDRYKRAIRPLNRAPRDWESWLKSWETTVNEGIAEKMAFALDIDSLTEDFFEAVQVHFPMWVESLNASRRSRPSDYGYRDLAQDFKNAIHRAARTKTRPTVARGAFGPTFNGEVDDEEGRASTPTPKEPPKRKRAPTTSYHENSKNGQKSRRSDKKCKACGTGGHEASNCWLEHPELCPEWATPHEKARDRFEARKKGNKPRENRKAEFGDEEVN